LPRHRAQDSFSSIRVRIPDGLGYHVNAHTSFGRISSDLPITTTGSMSPESLDGTIAPAAANSN